MANETLEKVLIHPQVVAQLPPCPRCAGGLRIDGLLWQGIHICAEATCLTCSVKVVADLPMGHATCFPYVADLQRSRVHGSEHAMGWLGRPFLDSLLCPSREQIPTLRVHRRVPATHVVLLNCLDYLYGHALLKLLNADLYRPSPGRPRLIVVVPECLAWMVPAWAAEVWTVGGPLKVLREYSPALRRALEEQLQRFALVELSPAAPHPLRFDISHFTGFSAQADPAPDARISFIWREDRLWRQPFWSQSRLMRRLRPMAFFLAWQCQAVTRFFETLRLGYARARFTVLGLGRSTHFPSWIDDQRVDSFTPRSEAEHCQAYAESRLVVGVHGSNLLLPSAHAGATLDLMPDGRWGNMTEDILYQEPDPRLAAWRYRFVSANVGPLEAAKHAEEQLRGLQAHRLVYGAGMHEGD